MSRPLITREEQDQLWRETYAKMTPEQRRYADDLNKRVEASVAYARTWVHETNTLVLSVAGQGEPVIWQTLPLFWIRLHGLLTEIRENHRPNAELLEAAGDRVPIVLRCSIAIHEAISGVLAVLTEEELIFLDYQRQRAAHVKQDAYRLRLRNRGDKQEVKEHRHVELSGKTFTIDEVDAAIEALLVDHDTEQAVARHIAARIAATVQLVVEAVERLHRLPSY